MYSIIYLSMKLHRMLVMMLEGCFGEVTKLYTYLCAVDGKNYLQQILDRFHNAMNNMNEMLMF